MTRSNEDQDKLTCPMQSTQSAQALCERAKCAWWEPERKLCCILILARATNDIRVLLTFLMEATAPTQAEGPESDDDSAAAG